MLQFNLEQLPGPVAQLELEQERVLEPLLELVLVLALEQLWLSSQL